MEVIRRKRDKSSNGNQEENDAVGGTQPPTNADGGTYRYAEMVVMVKQIASEDS